MTDQTSTIPKGWKMTTLSEVMLSANTGLDAIKRAPIVQEHTDVRCFRIQDASQSKEYDRWGYTVVSEQNYKKFRLIKGDILIARTGNTIGVNYLVRNDLKAVFNNGLIRLRANERVTYDFLYKVILSKHFNNYIQSIAYGTSTQPNMQIGVLLNFDLLLPPLPEQRAIAAVLSSLDDKIEFLRKQNKTLEATAQAIFKEWFVNFNFPGSAGKMIDFELGKIPEGWKVGKLGNEVKIVYGKNLSTESLTKSGYTVFGANGQIGFYDKFIYEDPQVLVSCRGEASGKVNISLPESFVTNNSLVLEIADNSDLNFCYLKFSSLNNDYTNFVTGSAQPQITIDSLKNCDLLLPKKEVINLFNATVEPMDKKQLLNFYQIQALSTLRDTLLPKLMKGEVRVK